MDSRWNLVPSIPDQRKEMTDIDSDTQDAYNMLGAALTEIGYSPERIRLLAKNVPALRYDARFTQLTTHHMGKFTLPDVPEPQGDDAIPIEDFDFSARAYSCLKREGVNWLPQLLACTRGDLLNIRNFGEKNLEEVVEKLRAQGYHLVGDEV